MDGPPPPYKSSKSVSRSRTSRDELAAQTAALLRSPLGAGTTGTASASTHSSASVSRSRAPPDGVAGVTAAMHRTSLSGGASSASVSRSKTARDELSARVASLYGSPAPASSAQPPSYRSARHAPTRPPVVGSAPVATTITTASSRSAASTVTPLSAADSRRRVRELQRAAEKVSAALPRRETTGLFKAACATDLLFLIDTTSSMQAHIDAVKDQVRTTIQEIRRLFLNESKVRVAVVGYKDHSSSTNIEFMDFTSSEDRAREFLGNLRATGGADIPEDVLGGLRQAINASWKQQTKCIIHIGDAPPHGRTLHDLRESQDDYYKPGSEPHGLTYDSLIKQLTKLGVNYVFLKITHLTDRMAMEFGRIYEAAGADVRLLAANKYYGQVGSVADTKSREPNNSELLFTELSLGDQFRTLQGLIISAVTHSVSATTARLSVTMNKGSKVKSTKGRGTKSTASALSAITEDDAREVVLEKAPPKWNVPGWFDQKLVVDGVCPEVVVYTADTLNDMMDSDENIKMSFAQLTLRARSKPFGKGAMRVASYAQTEHSSSRFVVKSFLEDEKGVEYMIEDMRIQALCKVFALEFNGLLDLEQPIDFVVTACLESKSEGTCVSLEPFIEGSYVKYNNNAIFVKEDTPDDSFNRVAQAFSHFTFERSWGHFMVMDLQGVDHLLTDPCIHTKDPDRFKLNDTNLNSEGFKCFFAVHKCNPICAKLGLKSNRDMVISGDWEFRETWPAKEPTVCCSNRLCHRIIRVAKAHKSEKFVGHHWCDACWKQLKSSMTQQVCAGPGPAHEFEVSHFFYESQGRYAPNECPEHIKKDATASTAAVVGGSLWNKMKTETQHRSISGSGW